MHVRVALSFFSRFFADSRQRSRFICTHSNRFIVNMAYAEAAKAQILASIKYRSLKFSTLPNANASDIARALLFHVQLDEIEAIQQDPGKGNWSIILKSISTAEKRAERGFTLLEQQVFPVPYNARLIAAIVAFAPHGTTADDILEALADYADIKQILPIFLTDFPSIKSGKYRVMLKPRGEGPPEEILPSYITLHRHRASLFYAGRIPRCPYCNSATHLGRDCPHKGQKKCFHCDQFGHVRAECPNIIHPNNNENPPSGEVNADHSDNNNITAVAKESTPVENSAELFTPLPENTTTESRDSSQDSDPAGSTSSTHDESPERSRSPLSQAEIRKTGQQTKKNSCKKT